jgi:hypothetical protein
MEANEGGSSERRKMANGMALQIPVQFFSREALSCMIGKINSTFLSQSKVHFYS